jgi:predicted Kef-type K+ transport protein
MGDEHVVFLERALVEQHLDPLARGQLALGVLAVDPLLAAAEPCAAPLVARGWMSDATRIA